MLLPGRVQQVALEGPVPQPSLSESLRIHHGVSSGPPASPWECGPAGVLRRPDAWLLWFVIFALQSGGLLLNTNLGLITSSRVGTAVTAASANAMFSASQSLGRLSGARRLHDAPADPCGLAERAHMRPQERCDLRLRPEGR
uniref:Uncharacterized protein n=1 Tax=Alexandrium monilatum TaxID=311494 RepID=A0A7S4UF27_9DINO